MTEELNLQINRIKHKLILFYMVLLSIEVGFNIYLNYFFGDNTLLITIMFIFLGIVLYTFLLTRATEKAKLIFHLFFIYASLLVSFITLNLLEDTLVCAFWVMPIPYAAYILLGKKQSIFYTVYLILLMVAVLTFKPFFSTKIIQVNPGIIAVSDSCVWFFNLITFGLLIYFDEQIQQTKEKYFNENKPAQSNSFESAPENNDKWEAIFEQIKDIVETDFKDPALSVGKITEKLNSNHVYISQAIKAGGFDNFNDYINSVRIGYVKTRLAEGALQTTTLFYIYSEAGFINNSTFNRAFKKIENITPSEYVKRLNRKK